MSTYIRKPWGRGFTYYSESGERLANETERDFIDSLSIPPAWDDVYINTNRAVKLYAWGRDSAGRKQYIYNPNYTKKQEKKKYQRIVRFGKQLETMRRATGQHLRGKELSRDKVLACMVRLIDNAYFRPGNQYYADENHSYGLTTMRSRHLELEGDTLVFDYKGKSGQHQVRAVQDKRLAKIVAELDETPGYEIFKYYKNGKHHHVNSSDLNEYIKEIMGEDFSAKDFRTWAGTVLAAIELDILDKPQTPQDTKKNIVAAVKKVAQQLGNTPSVARSNYIDPRVIASYDHGRTISFFKSQTDKTALSSAEEQALLRMLQESTF